MYKWHTSIVHTVVGKPNTVRRQWYDQPMLADTVILLPPDDMDDGRVRVPSTVVECIFLYLLWGESIKYLSILNLYVYRIYRADAEYHL